MLLVRRNNNQNWLNNWFDDNFFDTQWMPRVNGTAPAVNVKETATEYTMEVAVPGLKKEWVRMNIDADGLMNVAIENKMEHKDEDKHTHYLLASLLTAIMSRLIPCLKTLIAIRLAPRLRMVS